MKGGLTFLWPSTRSVHVSFYGRASDWVKREIAEVGPDFVRSVDLGAPLIVILVAYANTCDSKMISKQLLLGPWLIRMISVT